MLFEEPVTEIYRQVNLITLHYFDLAFVLFHVDCHKFVADFWSVLSRVMCAKRFFFINVFELLGICFVFFALLPSDFFEAFAEENHKLEYCLIESILDFSGHLIQIICENLVNQHLHFFRV